MGRTGAARGILLQKVRSGQCHPRGGWLTLPVPTIPLCLSGPHKPAPVPMGPLRVPRSGPWHPCLSDLIDPPTPPQTSAQTPAGSVPCACPAEAVPAAPVTGSSVTGPTDPCARKTGTRMTTTAGASRPNASSSVPSPPGTRARVVSTVGGCAWSRLSPRRSLPPSSRHLHPSHLPPGWRVRGLRVLAGLFSVSGLCSPWGHEQPAASGSPLGRGWFCGASRDGVCPWVCASLRPSPVCPSFPLGCTSCVFQPDPRAGGRAAPAAGSPRSEVCPSVRGGGSLLPGRVALRASGQTPPRAPWV